MEYIKIKFVDFWVDFNRKSDNYFVDLLSLYYDIQISDDPDILFYSCFGNEHLKYNCTKIFFTPENWRPNYFECDYSISFDYLTTKKNIRIPLWYLYFLTYEKDGFYNKQNQDSLFENWQMRKNFCCLIISNSSAKERIRFYEMLNKHIVVDSAGGWNNSIGKKIEAGTKNKFDFIKSYRFVISFENSSNPGYTTEKILEPLLAGCIPIYWGDPEITSEFNASRFIHVKSEVDFEDCIQKILKIENNKELARSYFQEGIFNEDNSKPEFMDMALTAERLHEWVENARSKKFKGIRSSTIGVSFYYLKIINSKIKLIIYRIKERILKLKI